MSLTSATSVLLGQRKVAIVTGSSSGIGRGIAIGLSKRGYALTLCGRNQEELDTTKALCLQIGLQDSDILQIRGDLTEPEEPNKIASLTIEKFGRINALINNAAISTFPDTLNEATSESFDNFFKLNLKAPILLTKACISYLEQSQGVVINISSTVTSVPNFGMMLYGAAKAGLDYFTTSMACAYGPKGVRVCGVLPGYIPTPGLDNFFQKMSMQMDPPRQMSMDDCVPQQLLKRIGSVEDVSNVVSFLVSEEAALITGVNLTVDAGLQFQRRDEA